MALPTILYTGRQRAAVDPTQTFLWDDGKKPSEYLSRTPAGAVTDARSYVAEAGCTTGSDWPNQVWSNDSASGDFISEFYMTGTVPILFSFGSSRPGPSDDVGGFDTHNILYGLQINAPGSSTSVQWYRNNNPVGWQNYSNATQYLTGDCFVIERTNGALRFKWIDHFGVSHPIGLEASVSSNLYLYIGFWDVGAEVTNLIFHRTTSSGSAAGFYPTLCPFMSSYGQIGSLSTSNTVVTDSTTGTSISDSTSTAIFGLNKMYCINGFISNSQTAAGDIYEACSVWDDNLKICSLRASTYLKEGFGYISPVVQGYNSSNGSANTNYEVGDTRDDRPVNNPENNVPIAFLRYLSQIIGDGTDLDPSGYPSLMQWFQYMLGTIDERPVINVERYDLGDPNAQLPDGYNQDSTTGEYGEPVSLVNYLSTVVGMDTEARASFWRIQEHLHDCHWHLFKHSVEDGYLIDKGSWGEDAGSGGIKASVLVMEFVGNEDVDDNGLIYGYDFKIIDDETKPPMLIQLELHQSWDETRWLESANMTWAAYLASLEN
jgi:hypothetical protein